MTTAADLDLDQCFAQRRRGYEGKPRQPGWNHTLWCLRTRVEADQLRLVLETRHGKSQGKVRFHWRVRRCVVCSGHYVARETRMAKYARAA